MARQQRVESSSRTTIIPGVVIKRPILSGIKIKIYVVRIPKNSSTGDRLALAKPCVECERWFAVCKTLGITIEKIYYTDSSGSVAVYDGIPHRSKVIASIW